MNTHTRGPLRFVNSIDNADEWTAPDGRFELDDGWACEWMLYDGQHGEETMVASGGAIPSTIKQELLTARLLTAAYNSYDKHFGPRAVEAAEADALGEALEILRDMVAWVKRTNGDDKSALLTMYEDADALLDRVEGK